MEIMLIVLSLLALFHFIYEGILLPSFRMGLRNNLFSLRDEIRYVLIEKHHKSDADAFMFLEHSANNFISRLDLLDIASLRAAHQRLKADRKLSERINYEVNLLENHNNEKVRNYYHKLNRILLFSLVTNSGGWAIYFVPAIGLMFFWKGIVALLNSLIAVSPQAKALDSIIPVRT